MPRCFIIDTDLAGHDYAAFIEAAADKFIAFSLVWREKIKFAAAGNRIRDELEFCKMLHRKTNAWPGTPASKANADVIYYRFYRLTGQVLSRPDSLFAWLAPAFPEDLAFYGGDGRCAFASATHKKRAWILDLEFGRSLPKRFKLEERTLDEDLTLFDYPAW
jgi:hypothetical protein